MQKLSRYAPYLALTLLVAAAYSNVYYNVFLYDDISLILQNRYLTSWAHLGDIFTHDILAGAGKEGAFYRPLQMLLYLIVAQLAGIETHSFHALNVMLHALNACLVLALARKLGFSAGAALAGALLWAAHPVHVEAVTYASATADPLHVLFILAGLLAWDTGRVRSRLAAAGFFLLALLSKEAAIVFPALVAARIFLEEKKPFALRPYLSTWPLWLMAGLFFAFKAWMMKGDMAMMHVVGEASIYMDSPWVRLCTFLAALTDYAKMLAMPAGLHYERMPMAYNNLLAPPVLAGAGIMLGPLALALAALRWPERRGLRVAAFGPLWFLAAYFPCSGIVIPVNAIVLEHWMYLPAIGLFLAFTEALGRVTHARRHLRPLLAVGAALAVTAFGISTFKQNQVWATPLTLYENVLKYERNVPRVYNNLALTYQSLGDLVRARETFTRALAEGGERYPYIWYNMALLSLHEGKAAEAEKELRRALEVGPDFVPAAEALRDYYKEHGPKARYQELAARLKALYAKKGNSR